MKKIGLIIGNGKSSQPLVDDRFQSIPENVESFGTTTAFRYYEKIGWWPTYYALYDGKVVNHHKEDFQRFLLDETNPVKKWFLCDNLCRGYFKDPFNKLQKVGHDGTGCGITGQATRMNYDEIWLIGIDNQYIWKKDWVRRLSNSNTDNRVEFIADVEDNPNYAIPYYQQKGDVFSFNLSAKDGEMTKGKTGRWESFYKHDNIFDFCSYNNLKFPKKVDIVNSLKNLNKI